MLRLLFALHCLLAAPLCLAGEITGVILEVQDGDSLRLGASDGNLEIRLLDIDAPELQQAKGKDSRTSLRELCLLKRATVETRGDDRYGRTLATVRCAGVDAGAEQVRRGMAWVFVRYAPKDSPLYQLEREAKLEKRGLWADDGAVPPWEWRQVKGTSNNSALLGLGDLLESRAFPGRAISPRSQFAHLAGC
ncbi:MAG: nuclease [Betaproteobacteria bacterium]|nr:nuclease [Betaproteobacteria bacterium]